MDMIKNEDRTLHIGIKCRLCGERYILLVRPQDWTAYNAGALVQDAFPYLSPAERELFVSHTCERCWNEMFGIGREIAEDDE